MPVVAPEELTTVEVEQLLCVPLQRDEYVVKDLIPKGLTLFCGGQKVGKSWMMLDLCIAVSQGKPFLGFETTQGKVLYLCLEDTFGRIQRRVFKKMDQGCNIEFTNTCRKIGDGLTNQLKKYVEANPETKLIIIDTLQKVRGGESDYSYAKDYEAISALKAVTDKKNIAIVVVHHVRKMKSCDDIFNDISGTTGLSGCADCSLILQRERAEKQGMLFSVGRDIEYQELVLNFEDGTWTLIEKKDMETIRREKVPEHLKRVVSFVKERGKWTGSATELLAEIKEENVVPQVLSKHINQFMLSYLQEENIRCEFKKTTEKRILMLEYVPPEDDCDDKDDDSCSVESEPDIVT